ncbi:MAG: alternative ribosome rescue aminoacyl-tRNA hydrolase ArfB [Oryzihumus sp.]
MSTYTGHPGEDLFIHPAPGLPAGLRVHGEDLPEHFSRSTGPSGQGVDTTSAKVELRFDVPVSRSLSADQRRQVEEYLSPRLHHGVLVIQAHEHRSQWENRMAAWERLVHLLRESLEPAPPERWPGAPSHGSDDARIASKKEHARTKALRAPVLPDEE